MLYVGAFKMTSENNSINYVIAAIDRKDEIVNFLLEYFVDTSPYYKHLNVTKNQMKTIYDKMIPDTCNKGISFLALDTNTQSIIGLCINSIAMPTDIMQISTENSPVNVAKMTRLINELRKNCFDDIPDCTKMMQFRVLCVKPDHQGKGIGKALCQRTICKAQELGCNYSDVCAVSKKSQQLFPSLGFKLKKVVKHEDYKEDDKVIFPSFGELDQVQRLVKPL